MTAEERFTKIENAIQSLIEAQAEHAAQIGKHNTAIRDLIVVNRTVLTAIDGLTTAQQHTDEKVNILIDTIGRADEKVNILIDTIGRTDEKVNILIDTIGRTDEKVNILIDTVDRTDEKLNILIDTVDRIVRNRNGDKDKS